jgi:hypothetical protein
MGCKRRLGGSVLCMLITSCVLGCPDQGPHECTGQRFWPPGFKLHRGLDSI